MSCENNKPLQILVIGTLPPPIGGTTVLMQCLVNALKENTDVDVCVVNGGALREIGFCGFYRFAALPFRIFAAVRKVDVVTLHCSNLSIGLPVLLASRVLRKPLIIRKFGGNDFRDPTIPGRLPWLNEFVLHHVDLYLAETRQLVDQAKAYGLKKIRWFPNHRKIQLPTCGDPNIRKRQTCRRFVYVGHIREYKGILVLVEAAKSLPAGVSIDVYGPWFDDLDRNVFDNSPNIYYRGMLKPEDVVETMSKYDAFVLPTHHNGEGYPGSILEAYNAGLPVVVTRWRALPEIVDENVGILVEPRNATDLCVAMTKLTQDNALYQQLCKNTREKAASFSANHWAKEFVGFCRDAVGCPKSNSNKRHTDVIYR